MAHTLHAFLTTQQLPDAYLTQARRFFDPLIPAIKTGLKQDTPLILALNGCQGSGKSTLAAYLKARLHIADLDVLTLSLDDFYLGKAERQALATSAHPLFATRGVPGTHDLPIMRDVLTALAEGDKNIRIPRFDKARDDRLPQSQWTTLKQIPDVVIMEGWCWGAQAVEACTLVKPINALERKEDAEGIWRNRVNEFLREYEQLYPLMNAWLMLQAPAFDCVQRWRSEQEQKLIARLKKSGTSIPESVMDDAAIARFIAHYQRLTESLLTDLPTRADVVWRLDAQRQITHMQARGMFQSLEGMIA